jgi:hypothetical protein
VQPNSYETPASWVIINYVVARKSCATKQLQNTSFTGDPNSPLQHPVPIHH